MVFVWNNPSVSIYQDKLEWALMIFFHKCQHSCTYPPLHTAVHCDSSPLLLAAAAPLHSLGFKCFSLKCFLTFIKGGEIVAHLSFPHQHFEPWTMPPPTPTFQPSVPTPCKYVMCSMISTHLHQQMAHTDYPGLIPLVNSFLFGACTGEWCSAFPQWSSNITERVWAAVGLPQRMASFTTHAHHW